MRHIVVSLAAALVIACASRAEDEPAGRVVRIGYLAARTPDAAKSHVEAFRHGLRQLGYIEGKNLLIEYRYAAGRYDVLSDFAAEFVRLRVDVILAAGIPAARAARQATATIPIVMGQSGDPVGAGLVASLARPGGNVTGLSDFTVGVISRRLQLLKEMTPRATRVAVLLNPANPTNPLQLKEIQVAAAGAGVALVPLEVRGREDIDRAFVATRKERATAVVVLADPMFGSEVTPIAELAAKNRLPTIWAERQYVEAGGLISYGTNYDDLYRRAAAYVDRILKGAKPAELPVEQPTRFELVINLKTARALGISLPSHVLMEADHVIQ
jgi:putative ABC transport system substrate-binding protein